MKKVVINKINDYLDIDEIYCELYQCPNCGYNLILEDNKFCSDCGCEFIWEKTLDLNKD